MIDSTTVRAIAMERQHLTVKADRTDYDRLFRMMSPVLPKYWDRPGNPPELTARSSFLDYPHVFDMRSRREIVKGRFQGGLIGYIFSDELPLFAAIYSKHSGQLSQRESAIMELLHQEGPMNVGLMKEITGWRAKDITPVLHKLQQKFLVFEDQVDNEWDRAWYPFETEFPNLTLNQYDPTEALQTILTRFLYLHVFITQDMVISWYKLKKAEVTKALNDLEAKRKITKTTIDGVTGYVGTEDISFLKNPATPPGTVFVLHRNDFFVRSHEQTLKETFTHETYNVLQYIMIDGWFRGFVAGFFKIGPTVIEDVILNMDPIEITSRKDEILEAIGTIYDTELSPIQRYNGKAL